MERRRLQARPTLDALGVEQAHALSPLRVRPMTAEESAAFEERAAQRERLERPTMFAWKQRTRDGRQAE